MRTIRTFPIADEPWDTSVGGTLALRGGSGAVRARRGGPLASVIGRLLGLSAVSEVPAQLWIDALAGTSRERWTRRFGGRSWSSDCERTSDGIVEWIGPRRRRLVGLDLVLVVTGDASTLRLRSFRVAGIMVPPRGVTLVVTVRPRSDGGLRVAVAATVFGRLLVGYEGWLA